MKLMQLAFQPKTKAMYVFDAAVSPQALVLQGHLPGAQSGDPVGLHLLIEGEYITCYMHDLPWTLLGPTNQFLEAVSRLRHQADTLSRIGPDGGTRGRLAQ